MSTHMLQWFARGVAASVLTVLIAVATSAHAQQVYVTAEPPRPVYVVEAEPLYGPMHLRFNGFAAFSFNEAMVDFTIQNILQVGVGPSIDFVSSEYCFTSCSGKVDTVSFGADVRVGIAIGSHRRWRRAGFMLGVDLHPTFFGQDTLGNTVIATSLLLTLGGGFY